MHSWNEFETLWTSDKMIVCEKFVSRGLPLVHIDEKFLLYTNIVERMDTMQTFHDIGPIRLNLRSLIDSIRAYAVDWKNTLGEILIEKTLKTLKALQKHMMVCVCVCKYVGNNLEIIIHWYRQCFRSLKLTNNFSLSNSIFPPRTGIKAKSEWQSKGFGWF